MINLLKSQILTEKSLISLEDNKYSFQIDIRLNKKQIKKIFEELFAIKIQSLNTSRLAKKSSNSYKRSKSSYKKVIITLEPGTLIQFE